MNIVAIDYGRVRTGIAFSEGSFATPLTVISNSKNLVKTISDLANKMAVEQVVVGLPEGALRGEVLKFARSLEKTGVAVDLMPEDLTTFEAESTLKSYGLKNLKRYPIDALSAAVILQEWIDRKAGKFKI